MERSSRCSPTMHLELPDPKAMIAAAAMDLPEAVTTRTWERTGSLNQPSRGGPAGRRRSALEEKHPGSLWWARPVRTWRPLCPARRSVNRYGAQVCPLLASKGRSHVANGHDLWTPPRRPSATARSRPRTLGEPKPAQPICRGCIVRSPSREYALERRGYRACGEDGSACLAPRWRRPPSRRPLRRVRFQPLDAPVKVYKVLPNVMNGLTEIGQSLRTQLGAPRRVLFQRPDEVAKFLLYASPLGGLCHAGEPTEQSGKWLCSLPSHSWMRAGMLLRCPDRLLRSPWPSTPASSTWTGC